MVRLATIMLVISCLSLSKIAVTESLAAESPPNVNVVSELSSYFFNPVDGPAILEIEGLAKSERYGRSGLELYEVTQAIPGVDLLVGTYFEVLHLEVNGETWPNGPWSNA